MRRLLLSLAICSLVFAPQAATAQSDENYSNVRIVRLSLVQGEAQVFRPESGEWENALQNLPIQKGYALATGGGRVEVELESGATVRLDENSEMEFAELALVGGARVTTLRLESGNAVFYANIDKRDTFEILSGPYRVKVPRNARLRLSVYRDEVIVSVLKGNVDVETDAQTYRVAKNEELRLTTAFGAEVARRGGATEFEQWALDREEVLSASNDSQQYVNAPFRYGVNDLSNHGHWYNYAGYGYVWQPYSVGFVPYLNGNWYWVNGFGWTWVGFEPWGWLPYHYGSWIYTRHGWAWVPGGFYNPWHPGLVSWIRFGNGSYGWCPRSPHDRRGRHPHNANVVTATFNGGRPVVRNPRENLGGVGVVLDGPTREDLAGDRPGFGGRNPRNDRAGRGGRGDANSGMNTDTAVSTGAGPRNGRNGTPRSGFSGSTGVTDVPPRADTGEPSGRVPQPRGDVRFDKDENRYVNTPVREPDQAADSPRSGLGGSVERPRPNFSRGDSPRGVDHDSSGTGTGAGAGYGAQPRSDSAPRGSGYSGRPSQSSGQRPDSTPRATPTPSQQRPSSPPPRATPQPSQPRQSSPPPRATPQPQPRSAPSSPPPQARPSSPPARSSGFAARPAPRPTAAPVERPAPKRPTTTS